MWSSVLNCLMKPSRRSRSARVESSRSPRSNRHQLFDYHMCKYKNIDSLDSFLLLLNLSSQLRMTVKRKRSISAISPFSSASSATLSSRDPSISPCPNIQMLDHSSSTSPLVQRPESVPSYLHSRTRKRFRDNRPDETIIHGMRL